MKISPSIYSRKEGSLIELVQRLDQYKVDSFHVDCNDNWAVFEDIETIRSISKTPVDLHIISPEPQAFIDKAVEMGVEYIQVQLEDARQPFRFPENSASRFGIALVSGTPVEAFEPYADSCFFILFMTTTPGQSGGVFNKENFRRIRSFARQFPGKRIHVDGGVNGEVSFILRLLGVDSVVSGSYLVNHELPGVAMLELLHREVQSEFCVGDFMEEEHLPVIAEKECSFLDAVMAVEKFGHGFIFYTDEHSILKGISSNADIRRAVLKHASAIQAIQPDEFINRKPLTVNINQNITEMLRLIKRQSFPVNFLPVTDEQNRLRGYLTFNALIRGES
jgi:ribulose-phosphate 3-epimerase